WSAFHFFRRGEPIADHAARCPATMAALAEAPMPQIAGRSPMALFSVLPPGCRLRVGNEVRAVEQDRLMIFDDTIEHEAWNDGNATRVVLLFEVWRPELEDAEKTALTALFGAINAYGPAGEDQAGA